MKNPLCQAIKNENKDIVDLFFDQGVEVNHEVSGRTLLGMAASVGSLVMIQSLVDRGADVNLISSTGKTALFSAVQNKQIHAVKMLLRLKADPFLAGPGGSSAMSVCKDPKIRALLQ